MVDYLKRTFWLALLSFSWLALAETLVLAATHIGNEALVATPASAYYAPTVNFRPGSNDTVNVNPPLFSWSYTPDPRDMESDIVEKTFQFQVSSNADFSTLAVDLRTRYNFYNYLAPMPTNVTMYWRVHYVGTNGLTNTLSSTRPFWISNAVTWARNLLTNESYLATNGAHPHMLFNAQNRLSISNSLQGDARFQAITNRAAQTVTNQWWVEAFKPTNGTSGGDWSFYVGEVAFCWQMTRNPIFSNAGPSLVQMARYYMSTQFLLGGFPVTGAITDGISQQEFIEMQRQLAFGYDWAYAEMSAAQRSEVLSTFHHHCLWYLYAGGLYARVTAPTFGNPDANYPRPYAVNGDPKGSSSHSTDNLHWVALMALSGYADTNACREFLDFFLNYHIGVTYCFGMPLNQGRIYGQTHVLNRSILYASMVAHLTFTNVGFNQNPFWNNLIDHWDRAQPVGYAVQHNPWGDVEEGGRVRDWLQRQHGYFLSLYTGNGVARAHWTNELTFAGISMPAAEFDELTIPFQFAHPPATNTPTLGSVDRLNGYAFGSSKSPSALDGFTNGIGFIMQARPRGSESGHSFFSDGSFELWAYGANIASAGGGLDAFSKVPFAHYSLMVNGLGQAQNAIAPKEQIYGQFLAFTNGSNATHQFTYALADLTYLYPHTNIFMDYGGWIIPEDYKAYNSTGALRIVTKVRRHILQFVQPAKYWVIYDELSTSNAARFDFVYPLLQPGVSIDTASASFTYPRTNWNGATVSNLVKFINTPGSLLWTNMTGTVVRNNPVTGENYYTAGSALIETNRLWVRNATATTNWHFMTVIYPAWSGEAIPNIVRHSDSTFAITNAGLADVISFGETNSSPASTFIIDTFNSSGGAALGVVPRTVRGLKVVVGLLVR